VFALLAFVCLLPGSALADSSGAQYEEAVPAVPSKSGPAGSSSSGAGGQVSGGSGSKRSSGGSANDGSSSDDDKSGGAGAGKGGGGNGQGSQGGGAANEAGVGGGQAIAAPERTGAISHGSGSSPLVPILIALAVLAAISIGVVTMRRRKQDGSDGSGANSRRVSPEAG
jgi:cobalamin biosynthesis Mg chelatase CobN